MAACPVCQSEIEITSQHYGTLYTCPSCSAVFFVDWGGQPEGAPEQPETLEPVVGEAFSPPVPEPTTFEEYQEQPTSTSTQDYSYQTPEETPAEVLEESSEIPYDFSQPISEMHNFSADPTEPIADRAERGSLLSDITNFANADVTQAAFNYTLTISGIDSAAVYQQVKEALTDSKFGWNIIQVMTQIKDGVLTIRSVNAVKASIIVQRIKYLPVKVSWRQDVLSGSV
jgi:hypothetical protein